MKKNILAVGAHPDDVEIGCGGTLVKHLETGDNVYVLVMTNGESGAHTENREECFNSLTYLGIKKENIFFGNFPDGFVPDNKNTVTLIEKYINELQITRVYTHYYQDRHQDHRNCSLAVSAAARKIPEILLYQSMSSPTSFQPHFFIELEEHHLKKKLDSLKCYKTQTTKGIVNIKYLDSWASIHGINNHAQYAEAYALNHIIMRGDHV